MLSEAGNVFIQVHLDHVQPKSQSQDYALTSRSAIWLQNSNCARTRANGKGAEKKFVPKLLAKGLAYQERVLKERKARHTLCQMRGM